MLASDEVAVWWLATEAVIAADLRRWLDLLDEDERERASRLWLDFDRREFVAAHALLRSMLTYYSDQPATAWRFVTDEYGKPKVVAGAGHPELQFNLAHTRGLVAAAVTAHDRVGIDVEKIDEAKSDSAVARAFFAPAELELLRRVPEAEWPVWFFRVWTLKEAYIKAIGTGLNTPLQSFSFTFDPIRITFAAAADDHPQDWHFTMLPTTAEHVLSLAVHRPAGGPLRLVPRALRADCL
jgi:4'-phosphopantetheinyl transferase